MGFSLDELSGKKGKRVIAVSSEVKRLVIRGCVMLGALAAIFVGAKALQANEVRAAEASAQQRQIPIYSVETDVKKVAISFDAAWGADKTGGIMDILEEYDVPATFYLVGFWVDKYPEKVQEINNRGFEIGNHSSTHPKMTSLSAEQMLLEVNTCSDKIEELTGVRPRLFRPPYGDYNDTVVKTLRDAGYEVTQWNTDSLDWKNLGVQSMVNQVTKNVKAGDIVLFHNNSDYILEAVPLILTWFKNNGYEVVNVGELLLDGEYYVDHTGKMRAVKP